MSAADAPFIKRHPKVEGPLGFWGLRAQGLEAVQALSAEHWTDYNLHDPGVTILEQVCYALTGLVYRADFAVADHLTGVDGRIDFGGQALHPADEVFPCRPATADDYRRLLLDKIDGLAGAAVEPGFSPADTVPGLWRVELRMARDHEAHAPNAAQAAMNLLRAKRNLGEDFAHRILVVEERWCELHGEIEVGGARDPADVLAEVYYFCEKLVAAWGRFVPLDSLLEQGASLDEIFTGPAVRRGLLQDGAGDAQSQEIFISDLMTGLRQVEGVYEVRSLSLRVIGDADEAANAEAVPRRGPGWALRLRVPSGKASKSDETGTLQMNRVRLLRRGSQIDPSTDLVYMKYEDLLSGRRALITEAGATAFIGPRPQGVYRAPLPHQPVQEQFPAVYGVNSYGLEPGASARDKALAWQLKAYLVLFDQVMANSTAQLANLRDLFAVDSEGGARPRSYWWHLVDDESVPGIEQKLYDRPPAQIEQRVFRPFDDALERKSRLMDYLLSLHGETYAQNSLRQFASGFTPAELEWVLYENKAAVLKDIIAFSRDRAGGFNDSQPSWNVVGAESGLQRRVGLLLGFAHTHTRSLTEPLARWGGELAPAGEWKGGRGESAGHFAHRPARLVRLMLDPSLAHSRDAPRTREQLRVQIDADLARMPALSGSYLNEALLRCGVGADRYWLAPASGGRHALFAGPDESGAFWSLGDFDSEAAAARVAAILRNQMLRLNECSEGLFVVEHLLLRPVGESPAHERLRQHHGVGQEIFEQRVSVVFPAWPLRCRDSNFTELAAETVRINAPAHLGTSCVWFDFGKMAGFEKVLHHWLNKRERWCAGDGSDEARTQLNDAACDVLHALLPKEHHARGAS